MNFERALRQAPYSKDARHNLWTAQQLIDTPIKAPKGFWFFKAWERLVGSLHSKTWAVVLWFFLFIGAAGFIFWFNSAQAPVRRLALRVGIASASFSLIPFLCGFQASSEEYNRSFAIVVNSKAGIRSAPGLDGEDIMVLSAGVKARITEQSGDWLRVRLDNGVLGWMPAKMLERI